MIDRHAHGWSVERIQPLERSIMRVALIEMLHPDAAPADEPIPPEGAIEEAVESAKTFCGAGRSRLRQRRPGRSPARRARECTHPMSSAEQLDDLIARLERAAEQLRSGELSPDAAATLVEDCASLATQAAAELEQLHARRGARAGSRPGHAPVGAGAAAAVPHQLPGPPPRGGRALPAGHALLRGGRSRPGWRRRCATRCSRGGKRIRPVLALATARAVGLEQHEVLPLAGAIELIHTYSLIHDDLPAMDDDALRRGQPTCHVKFGEDVAILAGDGLYAEAFRHLLTHQRAAPERVLAAAAELAAATGVNGMVGGQYADVSAEHALRRRGPAPAARAQDGPSDRRLGALRTTVDGDRRRSWDRSLPPLRR